jgi:acetyl esterase/lipase
MTSNSLAPCLNWTRLKYFQSHYAPKTPEELWALKSRPLFFLDPILGNLQGLCPTFVATASADPLCDEGEAYARKLAEAGVLTTARRYTGVPHPFMHMAEIKKAQMYREDMCNALKLAHGA